MAQIAAAWSGSRSINWDTLPRGEALLKLTPTRSPQFVRATLLVPNGQGILLLFPRAIEVGGDKERVIERPMGSLPRDAMTAAPAPTARHATNRRAFNTVCRTRDSSGVMAGLVACRREGTYT